VRREGADRKRGPSWSDESISPAGAIAYRVREKMGDTRGVYRLFMAPGMPLQPDRTENYRCEAP
jgi:hypothetical protein